MSIVSQIVKKVNRKMEIFCVGETGRGRCGIIGVES